MEFILEYLNQGVSAIIPFVILLGVLVFVHELGHFMVARWCGVRVEVFSLGFGKKIFQFKRGATTYAISIIPLGGYVKMFGEQNGDVVQESERHESFSHKNVWNRIAIVSAGPLMNFFFAVVVFGLIAFLGEEHLQSRLGDISKNTAAYAMGFRSGDLIQSINNEQVSTWEDVSEKLNLFRGLKVDFVVQRENTEPKLDSNPKSIETISAEIQSIENLNPLSASSLVGEIEGLKQYSTGTTVGVAGGSPLKALGLKVGDQILKVNDQEVSTWRSLESSLAKAQNSSVISFEVRDVEDKKGTEVKNITVSSAIAEKELSLGGLGIESSETYVGKVRPNSPAEKAGIQSGDRISYVSGKKINQWEDVLNNIKAYDESGPLKIQLLREDSVLDVEVVPSMTTQMNQLGVEEKRFTIGIEAWVNVAKPELTKVRHLNPITALGRGLSRTSELSVMTVMSFVRLIQQKISHKNIGGVIAIGQAASEAFKVGLVYFLQMMGILSVNLFILNLLPIPVLDGGHLLFYTIELIKGSPLSMSKMEVAQQIGLVLLLSLMVLSLFNDVTRVFGL
ncbi:MAG TPA: RIP metalloprotease RseP [Pseudobdellovibrionaceae bacterium]|nr:RIP metalloprotease RseP [Pseudobdellovibrionaceae bacterium]